MNGIFISYRRDDTAAVSKCIYDRLAERFGAEHVFRDLDAIPAGADFEQRIRHTLRTCKVAVVLIGPSWLDIKDSTGARRLDLPGDFVCLEVDCALQRNIRVIPVLVNGVDIPKPEQLPQRITRLSRLNALRIREGVHLEHDITQLVEQIADAPDIEPPANLQTMRNEMDRALADELVAVQQTQNQKGISATDGRLTSNVEGAYLYRFTLDRLWEPQEDTPLQVEITEDTESAGARKVFAVRKISGAVMTADGTHITISVGEKLSDQALKRVRLFDDKSRLIEMLRTALSETDETAVFLGSKTFNLAPAIFSPPPPIGLPPCVPPGFPDDSQRRAIEAALGSEVAYIIGPPGTGKTQTLATIAYAHLRNNRSVLIAAHTNIAVDNAIEAMATLCHGMAELEDGKIVRYGAPKLDSIRSNEYVYPPKIAGRKGRELEQRKRAAQEAMNGQLEAIERGESAERDAANTWKAERQRLVQKLSAAEAEKRQLVAKETERKRLLEQSLAQTTAELATADRAVARVRDSLARMAGEQMRFQTELERLTIENKQTMDLLRRATGMSAVARFLRGINIGALQHQVADGDYRARTSRGSLETLTRNITISQDQREQAEHRAEGLRRQREQLAAERDEPTSDVGRIVELTGVIERCGHGIKSGTETRSAQNQTWVIRHAGIQRDVRELQRQIDEVEAQLTDLEKQIVENALVVGTTLTRTYTGGATRNRRFDVVIIDEASIAPMPAVYVVASRANESATIVGDPCQLSPICQAKTPAANKWLKRDLFGHVGIAIGNADGGKRSVMLQEQYRMHPAISIIPRRHVYEDRLGDGNPGTSVRPIEPMMSSPLVLCDTSRANPRVTKPPYQSRYNEYHALCTVHIAKMALASLGDHRPEQDSDKLPLGIVTPYSPHAQRISQLLKQTDAQMARRIRVGTTHSFQGLEFDVVIFDTVESPPLKPHSFIAGQRMSEATRLVNVAVTRAKHKLIIVANATYLRATLGRRDTTLLALEEAAKAATIDSCDSCTLLPQVK